MTKKIVSLIIARNEESNIEQCIAALQNQTYDSEIVLIDDGSTDNTVDRSMNAGVAHVYPYKPTHLESWLDCAEFGLVHDFAMTKAFFCGADYIMIMGADHILAEDYVEILRNEMEKDKNIFCCSGVIKNEKHYISGSGRMYRHSILDRHKIRFRNANGWEDLIMLEGMEHGYNVKVFDDAKSHTLRKTSSNYTKKNALTTGAFYKETGAGPFFICARVMNMTRHGRRDGLWVLLGYMKAQKNRLGNYSWYYTRRMKDKLIKR